MKIFSSMFSSLSFHIPSKSTTIVIYLLLYSEYDLWKIRWVRWSEVEVRGRTENGPRRLICLDIWSSVGDVWKEVGDVIFLEERCITGFQESRTIFPLWFSATYLWIKLVALRFPTARFLFHHHGLLPSETVSPIKSFLSWVTLAMVFCHKNRKVTKTRTFNKFQRVAGSGR